MTTETITIERAYAMGVDDLRQAVTLGLAAPLAEGERTLLCDGSMYSPSHRALPRGEYVYQLDDMDLWEAYTEGVDAGAERTVAPDDVAVYWEDGCLFADRD